VFNVLYKIIWHTNPLWWSHRSRNRLFFFRFYDYKSAVINTRVNNMRKRQAMYEYYIFWLCVCSLMYPQCKAHAPYNIAICGQSVSTIFFTLSHKRHDFRKKKSYCIWNVFWLSLQVLFETFLNLRRNKRDMIINVYWFWSNVPVILGDRGSAVIQVLCYK